MADKLTLDSETRTEFGKGAARRARRANKIPAVLYGHGADPQHIALPGHDTMLALKHPNALLHIKLEGTADQLTIARDIQRDPVTRLIEHVDLLVVRKGEKITVDVTVHLEGESAPGTIHILESSTLSIAAEATHLPEYVTIDIEGMDEGDKVLAGDVKLPDGSVLEDDPEMLVVAITVPRQALEDEEEETEEGDEAEGEDGEGDEGDAESSDGDDS